MPLQMPWYVMILFETLRMLQLKVISWRFIFYTTSKSKVLWSTTFVLFISDTQLWFTLLCSILGVATVMVQRGCRCFTWALEDSVAKLPERFSRKVPLRMRFYIKCDCFQCKICNTPENWHDNITISHYTDSVLFKDAFLSEQDNFKRRRLARFRCSRIPSRAQRVELEPNRWQKVSRRGTR